MTFRCFVYLCTAHLLCLSSVKSIFNDNIPLEFGYEHQFDGQDKFYEPDVRPIQENFEVSSEHLERYWGLTVATSVFPQSTLSYDTSTHYSTSKQISHEEQQNPKDRGIRKNERYSQIPSAVRATNDASSDTTKYVRGAFSPTNQEVQHMTQLRHYISTSGTYSTWLRSATETEIVRFLRARKGDCDAAWQMMWDHSNWRNSPIGADSLTALDDQIFENSFLNQELYWSGQAFDGTPVLFFKTAFQQSGAVDPQYYTRFVVWLLEKGKRLYGVGLTHQLIVIVDRSPSQNKEQSFTFGTSAASNLPIMRAIFSAVQNNYPEVLQKAFVVPANSVTRMLFYGASALMDERSREKFTLIRGDDTNWWKSILPENVLSPSLTKSKEVPREAEMPNRYSIDNYGYQVQY